MERDQDRRQTSEEQHEVRSGAVGRVFIARASRDRELVDAFRSRFTALGTGWALEPDVPNMTDWWPLVSQAIQRCDAFVACDSSAFRASRWCDAELRYAEDLEKRVLVVALPGEMPNALRAGRPAIRLTGSSVEAAARRLADELRSSPPE